MTKQVLLKGVSLVTIYSIFLTLLDYNKEEKPGLLFIADFEKAFDKVRCHSKNNSLL